METSMCSLLAGPATQGLLPKDGTVWILMLSCYRSTKSEENSGTSGIGKPRLLVTGSYLESKGLKSLFSQKNAGKEGERKEERRRRRNSSPLTRNYSVQIILKLLKQQGEGGNKSRALSHPTR